MKTEIDIIQNEIAEKTREILKEIPNLQVLEEDRYDTEFEATNAIAKLKLAVIIGFDGWDRKTNSGRYNLGKANYNIVVYEKTAVTSIITPGERFDAQDVAFLIQRNLHWTKTPHSQTPLLLSGFNRRDEEGWRVFVMRATVDCGLEAVYQTV